MISFKSTWYAIPYRSHETEVQWCLQTIYTIFDCRAKGCILVFRNSCRWTPKDEDVFSWMQDRSIVYTAHVLHKCNLLQESFQTSTERLRKERGLLLIWLGIMFHRFVDWVELWRTLTVFKVLGCWWNIHRRCWKVHPWWSMLGQFFQTFVLSLAAVTVDAGRDSVV